MKKFILPIIAIVTFGCSSPSESTPEVEVVVERTVEEINAERGDPCDCIESKIEVIDAFIAEVHEGKFSTSELLNKAFSATMDGCLSTLGHVEADLAWSQQLKQCESFSTIRDAMIEVKNQVMSLKNNEQNEYVEDIDEGGATEVLDKLKESAH